MQKIVFCAITTTVFFSHVTANIYHEKILNNSLNQLAKLCHKQKPGINDKAKYGQTPLHLAVIQNKPKMVSVLLGHGAIVLSTNDKEQTPLHSAAKCNFSDILRILLNNLSSSKNTDAYATTINWQDKHGNTALHLAALNGNFKCAIPLVNHGANLLIKNKYGQRPADLAKKSFDEYQENDPVIETSLELTSKYLKINTDKQEVTFDNF